MRSWTNSFFSLTHFSSKKQSKRFESKTEKPNPSYSNPQSRVPIYLFQSDKSSHHLCAKTCVRPTHSLFPFQRGATQNTLHWRQKKWKHFLNGGQVSNTLRRLHTPASSTDLHCPLRLDRFLWLGTRRQSNPYRSHKSKCCKDSAQSHTHTQTSIFISGHSCLSVAQALVEEGGIVLVWAAIAFFHDLVAHQQFDRLHRLYEPVARVSCVSYDVFRYVNALYT